MANPNPRENRVKRDARSEPAGLAKRHCVFRERLAVADGTLFIRDRVDANQRMRYDAGWGTRWGRIKRQPISFRSFDSESHIDSS